MPILHSIDAATYHADALGGGPYLSQSIIKILITEAPDHARERHPRTRVFKDFEWPSTDSQRLGTVCHSMILGESHRYKVFNPADYLTKKGKPCVTLGGAATQRAIEEWRADGGLDIGAKVYRNASACVGMTTAAIMEAYPSWADGHSEVTALWQRKLDDHSMIDMKARIDRLVASCVCAESETTHRHIFDPKFSQRKFSDLYIDKVAEIDGWAIQNAMYVDGVQSAEPLDIPTLFTYVAIELYPPYETRFVTLPYSWVNSARGDIDSAANVWGHCLKSGVWPGRSPRHYIATRPEWAADSGLSALMESLEEEA